MPADFRETLPPALSTRNGKRPSKSPAAAARCNLAGAEVSHSMREKKSASEIDESNSTDVPNAINGSPRLAFRFRVCESNSNQMTAVVVRRR